MTHGFMTIQLRWLTESSQAPEQVLASEGDVVGSSMPMAPDMGLGRFDLLHLPCGSTLFKGMHRFLPAAAGRLVPLGEFSTDYGEPTFLVQTMKWGRCCQQQYMPEMTLLYEDGVDLFGHVLKQRVAPMVDGSSDSDMVSLCMKLSSVRALLGEGETHAMLTSLGIQPLQTSVVRPMPRSFATLLHEAMAKPFLGGARRLFAQAEILRYLSLLSDHLLPMDQGSAMNAKGKERIHALHDFLLALDGKLPTLEDLAGQFQLSARRLNAEFTSEYGVSIYTFITGHRLEQARDVLSMTDTPMKVISARLGYSHVAHFSIAFKRRFGVTPGSLRRTGANG